MSPARPFFVCDVFTSRRFGGNQLAVLPDALGLSSDQMQRIAREFNFSETTFVLPPEQGHTRRVRIFTPAREVPFAGHPNVGTAFVLAATGELGGLGDGARVVFEEAAGLVPVSVDRGRDGGLRCELAAPQSLSLGPDVDPESVAAAVSLGADEVATGTHPPRVAGVGLPFLIAELVNRDALGRARTDAAALDALVERGITPDIHLWVRGDERFDLRTRMFAPLDGVPEDPATGSANCALAALLAHCRQESDVSLRWRIAQGVEMGRPSVLEARAEKVEGEVTGVWIGGACAMVAEGTIQVE